MTHARLAAHPVEHLLQRASNSRSVVREQAPRNVREAFLNDGVLRVHPQRNALDHTEGPQDESEVAGNLERILLRQLFHLPNHLHSV